MSNDSISWRSLNPRHNITTRLVLIAAGGAVVLSVLVAAIAGYSVKRTLEDRAQTELKNYAYSTGHLFDLAKAAELHAVQAAAAQEVFSTRDSSVDDIRQALNKLIPAFAWAGFVDPAGRIVAASEGVLEGERVGEQDWFRKGSLTAHRGGVQEVPRLSEALGSASRFIAYAVPVKDAGGRLLGVLGVQQYWSFDIRNSALPADAAKQELTASFYLRPPQGILLLDSRGTSGGRHLRPPPTKGPQGFTREKAFGRDFVAGYAFNSDAEWPMMVVVRQPVDVISAPVRLLQIRIVEWGLALGALLAIPGYLTGSRLDRKLRFMAKAAQRIGAGDPLSVMPTFPSGDQLAMTAQAIAQMAESLRSREMPAVTPGER